MFGYVNISQGSISEEDKRLYSAYYCGLCKAIGEKSQRFRLTLSNELTFLAVLLSAVCPHKQEIAEGRHCIAHPFKKHREICFDAVLDYVSDMNILLAYLKVCDDAQDEGTLSDRAKRMFLSGKARAVEEKYPVTAEKIRTNLKRLYELEKEKSASVDMTADCFAKVLEAVFCPDCIGFDKETLGILGWMGYNMGRWVYIIDAYADLEKDRKNGGYNPFLYCGGISKATDDALYYTLANIANAYDLLKVYRNDSLIKNFLFSGLPEKQQYILTRTEEANGSL